MYYITVSKITVIQYMCIVSKARSKPEGASSICRLPSTVGIDIGTIVMNRQRVPYVGIFSSPGPIFKDGPSKRRPILEIRPFCHILKLS